MVNRYFEVDATELFTLADGFANGTRIVQQELTTAGREIGTTMVAEARALAPELTGELKGKIGPPIVAVVGSGIQISVASKARHARWQEEGTGIYGPRGAPIVPRTAQFLSWIGANGQRVFARSVRGTPGKWYMKGGLEAAQGRVTAMMAQAAKRVVARLVAGGR